jgi:putative FmdB family regulatory protein
MPLFEYQCQSCSKDFELLVRGSETPECPSCRSTSLQKRLSVFAAHANGSARTMSAAGPCGAAAIRAAPAPVRRYDTNAIHEPRTAAPRVLNSSADGAVIAANR